MKITHGLRCLYGHFSDEQAVELLRNGKPEEVEAVQHFLDRSFLKLKKSKEASLVSSKERERAYHAAFAAFLKTARSKTFQTRRPLRAEFKAIFTDHLIVFQLKSRNEETAKRAREVLGRRLLGILTRQGKKTDQETAELAAGETIVAVFKMVNEKEFVLAHSFRALCATIFQRQVYSLYRKNKGARKDAATRDDPTLSLDRAAAAHPAISPILSSQLDGEKDNQPLTEKEQFNLLVDKVKDFISGAETQMLDKLSEEIKYNLYDRVCDYMEDFVATFSKMKEYRESNNTCSEILMIKAREGTSFRDIYHYLHQLGEIGEPLNKSTAGKIKARINERVRYCRSILHEAVRHKLNLKYRNNPKQKKSSKDER